MDVTYIPVLAVLRDLYAQPRDFNRFRNYLDAMLQGTDDVVLPITVANPMAKEHALARVEELLALGADEIGAAAAREAATRLAGVPDSLKTTLVLADDAGGGWTKRYLSEANARFPERVDRKRNFAVGLLWTGETPGREAIREEVLGAIYRAAWLRRMGPAKTLRAKLAQEGLAAAFAGSRPTLPATDLDRARATIAPLLDAAPYPQQFAALYGDEAAVSVGYPPLGLAPRSGFQVALADALAAGRDPVAVLVAGPAPADPASRNCALPRRSHVPTEGPTR